MDARTHERAEPLNQRFGDPDSFCLEWEWAESTASDALEGTYAACRLWVDGRPKWGGGTDGGRGSEPVELPLAHLLEFLSSRWDWLRFEERIPLDLSAESPTDIWDEAETRWDRLGEVPVDEEEALIAFQDRHDVSQAFGGLGLESVWLLRNGRAVTVAPETDQPIDVSAGDMFQLLEDVGHNIEDRLGHATGDYAEDVVDRWRNRVLGPERRASIYTGFDSSALEPVWTMSDNDRDGEFEPDEFFAAARQLDRRTSPEEIATILDEIGSFESGSTTRLDEVASEVVDSVQWQRSRAFAEGWVLAGSLREWLVQDDEDFEERSRVEPREILESWGVEVRESSLKLEELDAVAVWGPAHGPGILINTSGKHAQHRRGLRSSLAHEICHLLVDRDRELPLAEVLGGSVPPRPEKRANAFAAELLLPREIAGGRAAQGLQAGRDPENVVENLCSSYGVGHEVTAWQIRRSDEWQHILEQIGRRGYQTLKNKVSHPEGF